MTGAHEAGDRRWTWTGAIALAIVQTAAIAIAIASGDGSPSWHRAIAFSAAVTSVGSLGGWLLARWPIRAPSAAVAAGLAAVAIRILLPLGGLAWLQAGGRAMSDVGAGGLLAAMYLALLATDVILHIMGRSRTPPPRGPTAKN